MATLYFCALPSATTPTWNRANIGTNAGFSDTPPMYGTQGSAPAAPQTDYEPTISWTGALTAGTSYKLWAIWDDGSASSNSGAPFGSDAFTTDTLAELAATGSTGAFSGTASSQATATFAATGGTGTFAGAANSTTTVTLVATGATGAFSGTANAGYSVTLSGVTAISITATSVQPQLDYTITGTPLGGETHFAVYPSTVTLATYDHLFGWSGFPTATGLDASPPSTTTANDEPAITWSSDLTPGESYKLWAAWDENPFSAVVSNIPASGAFTTLPLAELATTGATGSFSGTASSPATATLSATGSTGAFSGDAGASSAATLTATGGTGTFSGSANSTATALLAAAGESGIFTGSAFSPAVATLAATGNSGAFSGSATTVATASLAATGETGTFSGAANSTTTVSFAATGGSGIFGGEATGFVEAAPPPVSGGGLSNRSGAYPAGIKRAPYDLLNGEPRRRDEEDLRILARKRLIEDDETIMALLRGVMQSGIFEEDTV